MTHLSGYAVALIIVLSGMGLIGFIVSCIFKFIGDHRGSRTLSDEEGRMLQQIWDGLQKMEKRVSNLETILDHKD